ncbi:MAG TPA: histidine kinase [Bacteroidales bacterium]|nr:histidine kinase [Bacteroidales bacterium]
MKHPVFENSVRQLVWWLVWIMVALGQSVLFYYVYGSFIRISLVESFVSMIVYSGLALSIWYPFQYFNSGETRTSVQLTNIIIIGAITVSLWILLVKIITGTVVQEGISYNNYWTTTLPYRIGEGVFLYGLVILTYYLFISLTKLSERNAKAAKLESLVRETEIKMLRSQINPHFLFNSLNSISSLTITDPEKARDMVVKLSEFMRYALSRKDEQPVTLQNELDNLRLYLDIEKVRFGDKLITEESIENECLEFKIPVMLLQPLYENAVKYGVYESTGIVNIITEAKTRDRALQITISNNFDASPRLRIGTGTGLLNVSRRLELYYGNKASISTAKENGIFTVKLIIPEMQN